jgi:hypothetical protein
MKKLLSMILEITWQYIADIVSVMSPYSKNDQILKDSLIAQVKSTPRFQDSTNSEWQQNVDTIYDNCLTKDPRFFLSWPTIRKTMFLSSTSIVDKEMTSIKNAGLLSKTKEDHFGFPLPYISNPKSSPNLTHLLYHTLAYEKKTGIKIATMDFILEFGGGYGCLCKLLFQSGFKGTYVIFDLPLFSALQIYYLTKLGYSVTNSITKKADIYCLSSVKDVASLIKKQPNAQKSMFIATWSLSESPLAIRNKFTPLLKQFKYMLVAYQKDFGTVDNIKYFLNFKKLTKAAKTKQYHLHNIPNSYYLFGYS